MSKIYYDSEFFSPEITLLSEQHSRYDLRDADGRFTVLSGSKACYVYEDGEKAVIECRDEDEDYFRTFFDLSKDGEDDEYRVYNERILEKVRRLKDFGKPQTVIDKVTKVVNVCKGLRILNQDKEEAIYSFILSQQLDDGSVRHTMNKLCIELGGKPLEFTGRKYYAFPKSSDIAEKEQKAPDFLAECGAGYRDRYLYIAARRLSDGWLERLIQLDSAALINELESGWDVSGSLKDGDVLVKLVELHNPRKKDKEIGGVVTNGIGPKVANCIALCAFHRLECCPVDRWIMKAYTDFFGGGENHDPGDVGNDLKKWFGSYSGLVQQYMFYAVRKKEGALRSGNLLHG